MQNELIFVKNSVIKELTRLTTCFFLKVHVQAEACNRVVRELWSSVELKCEKLKLKLVHLYFCTRLPVSVAYGTCILETAIVGSCTANCKKRMKKVQSSF